MQEDDPNYQAECKLSLEMGKEDCEEYDEEADHGREN
jgi:hypothetical protein